MARPPGVWQPSTLDGPRLVEVDGEEFRVPERSACKLVRAGRFAFLHVKTGRFVFVLSPGLGMLVESPQERKSRAAPANWERVAGDFV